MNRTEIVARVRSYTRDFASSIFREADILSYINEGIDRCKEIIDEFAGMDYLNDKTSSPSLMPTHYHYLLAVYSAARCFDQDERHYQASTRMNEFETKLNELKEAIEAGRVIIIDPSTGEPVEGVNPIDYVDLSAYWGVQYDDVDLGVEGVE